MEKHSFFRISGLISARCAFAFVLLLSLGGCSDKKNNPVAPAETTGTVTDIDGQQYKTVKIGEQWWMAENLAVKHYRNGDAIPIVADSAAWKNLTTGAFCIYENQSMAEYAHGLLYNWYAVMDNRKIAPEGWHVPSSADWQTLASSLGGSPVAGGKMKETGTTRWKSPNTGATNESAFNALPVGNRDPGYANNYGYRNRGTHANFWSCTEFYNNNLWANFCAMEFATQELIFYQLDKRFGFSIRCVKD